MKLACAYLSGFMAGAAALSWDWWTGFDKPVDGSAVAVLTVTAVFMALIMGVWVCLDRRTFAHLRELGAERDKLAAERGALEEQRRIIKLLRDAAPGGGMHTGWHWADVIVFGAMPDESEQTGWVQLGNRPCVLCGKSWADHPDLETWAQHGIEAKRRGLWDGTP